MIFLADHQGLSWIRGKRETLDLKRVTLYHRLIWVGLVGMITTGGIMAWPLSSYLVTVPAFLLKMAFVVTLFINGLVIGHLVKVATERSFASLSWRERLPLLVSGAVSTTAWIGAFVAARLLGL